MVGKSKIGLCFLIESLKLLVFTLQSLSASNL